MSHLKIYSNPQLERLIQSVFPETSHSFQCQQNSNVFKETDSHYKLVLDLPGYEQNEIELFTENHNLIIDAKNDDRSFHKTFDLKSIDFDGIGASLNNGVLSIELEKSKSSLKQYIKIK